MTVVTMPGLRCFTLLGTVGLWVVQVRSVVRVSPASAPACEVRAHAWDTVPFGVGGGYRHEVLVEGTEAEARVVGEDMAERGGGDLVGVEPAQDGSYSNSYPPFLVVVRGGNALRP